MQKYQLENKILHFMSKDETDICLMLMLIKKNKKNKKNSKKKKREKKSKNKKKNKDSCVNYVEDTEMYFFATL